MHANVDLRELHGGEQTEDRPFLPWPAFCGDLDNLPSGDLFDFGDMDKASAVHNMSQLLMQINSVKQNSKVVFGAGGAGAPNLDIQQKKSPTKSQMTRAAGDISTQTSYYEAACKCVEQIKTGKLSGHAYALSVDETIHSQSTVIGAEASTVVGGISREIYEVNELLPIEGTAIVSARKWPCDEKEVQLVSSAVNTQQNMAKTSKRIIMSEVQAENQINQEMSVLFSKQFGSAVSACPKVNLRDKKRSFYHFTGLCGGLPIVVPTNSTGLCGGLPFVVPTNSTGLNGSPVPMAVHAEMNDRTKLFRLTYTPDKSERDAINWVVAQMTSAGNLPTLEQRIHQCQVLDPTMFNIPMQQRGYFDRDDENYTVFKCHRVTEHGTPWEVEFTQRCNLCYGAFAYAAAKFGWKQPTPDESFFLDHMMHLSQEYWLLQVPGRPSNLMSA